MTPARRVSQSHPIFGEPGQQTTFTAFPEGTLAEAGKVPMAELATCGFVTEARDVVVVGGIGTGKTHLAIALGVEAARRRFRVTVGRAADPVRELLEARSARFLGRLHLGRLGAHLLIVDELGFVPF